MRSRVDFIFQRKQGQSSIQLQKDNLIMKKQRVVLDKEKQNDRTAKKLLLEQLKKKKDLRVKPHIRPSSLSKQRKNQSKEKSKRRKDSFRELPDKEENQKELLPIQRTVPIKLARQKCKSAIRQNVMIRRPSAQNLSKTPKSLDKKKFNQSKDLQKRPSFSKQPLVIKKSKKLKRKEKEKDNAKEKEKRFSYTLKLPKKKPVTPASKCNSGRRKKQAERWPQQSQSQRLIKMVCQQEDSSKLSDIKDIPSQMQQPKSLTSEQDQQKWSIKDMSQQHVSQDFLKKVVKIQSVWRSYKVRKIIADYQDIICRRSSFSKSIDLDQQQRRLKEIQDQFKKNTSSNSINDISLRSYQKNRSSPSASPETRVGKKDQMETRLQEKWNQLIDLFSKLMKQGRSENTRQILQMLFQQSETIKKKLLGEQNPQDCQMMKQLETRRYKDMLDGQKVQQLLSTRQLVLRQRQKNQLRKIQSHLVEGRISKEKYEERKKEITEWRGREEKEVQQARAQFSFGLESVMQAILKTKRDLLYNQKVRGQKMLTKCFSEEMMPNKYRLMTLFVRQPSIQEIKKLKEFKLTLKQPKQSQPQTAQESQHRPQLLRTSNLRRQDSEEDEQTNFEVNQVQQNQFDVLEEEPQVLATQKERLRLKASQSSNAIVQTVLQEEMYLVAEEMIDSNMSARFKESLKKNPKKVRGINPNIDAVEEYLNSVIAKMQENWSVYLQRLQIPIPPQPLQMLSYLRVYEEDNDMPDVDQDNDSLMELILHQDLLDAMQNLSRENPNLDRNIVGYLQLHHRAVFQAFNQSLDYERPFGLLGRPFPWKAKNKFQRKFKRGDYLQMIEAAKERVLLWCQNNCGTIFDKPNNTFGNVALSQDQVKMVRDHRLSRLMATELFESEQKWMLFDDEQTQILMDVCHSVIKQFFVQEAMELLKVFKKE